MSATADRSLNERLKAITSDLQAQRAARAEAIKDRNAARDAFSKKDQLQENAKIFEDPDFQAAEEAVARVGDIEDTISALENAEKGILRMLGRDNSAGLRQNGDGTVSYGAQGWDGKRLLAEAEEYQRALELGVFTSESKFGTVSMGQICTREEAAFYLARPAAAGLPTAPAAPTGIGTDQGAIVPDVRGIIAPYLLPLTLLDIIPTGTTDSNIIQYVQVSAIPGYAAETAELALKPAEGLTLVDATAPVRTIAGWIKLARQAMDDIPALATMINNLLPWDVRRRLMTQMLAGDGTGVNLLGILNVSGIGAPASVAGDNVLDGFLRAITTVVLSDADPNFIAMNPLTFQNIAIMKASGSGEYMLEEPGGVQAAYSRPPGGTLWGLQVTQNRAIPQATPLVGDATGATLLMRQGVNVKTSDSDQDDFVKNRVTLLAECRAAFPVWRPSAFAKAPLG
jgi:HK97 family phage major capsid protein